MSAEKILVVDDDLNICELLRLYLTKDGYNVVVANDGQSAVSMFQEENPSLVLLDVMLPKLDGCQVHSTVMLSEVDRKIFKKLGVGLTCDPVKKVE